MSASRLLVDDLVEFTAERVTGDCVAEPQPEDGGFAGADVEPIVRRGLGPRLARVDPLFLARHDTIV